MSIFPESWFPHRFDKRQPIHWLAFGFGSGFARKAPGTFGTLAALPVYLLFAQASPWIYLVILVVAALAGILICGKTATDLGVHDHGGIVWDEFVGMWLTLLAVPVAPVWVLLGFILFRFFDIAKPWPIKWLDQKVAGGLGIMLDDILAGLFANIVLHVTIYFAG